MKRTREEKNFCCYCLALIGPGVPILLARTMDAICLYQEYHQKLTVKAGSSVGVFISIILAKRETLLYPLSAKSSPKRCPTENVSTAFGRPMHCQQHLHNRYVRRLSLCLSSLFIMKSFFPYKIFQIFYGSCFLWFQVRFAL